MQHFSIKWFDNLNLHLVSIILPSKDIKNYFACFSFRTINHKARIKQITGSLSKWPKTLLTLHSLSFLFLYMYSILVVHLYLWQIIRNLFQTSLFWNMKIYSRKLSWMCCTLCSSSTTKHNRQFCLITWIGLLTMGGSSRRAAGLQPSLKNVRQKILPNGQTRLKFGFSYENFTTQSFSVLPTPFRFNVSSESNKNNVSLLANDTTYAMTFSAHLPTNLAISGLSSAQP